MDCSRRGWYFRARSEPQAVPRLIPGCQSPSIQKGLERMQTVNPEKRSQCAALVSSGRTPLKKPIHVTYGSWCRGNANWSTIVARLTSVSSDIGTYEQSLVP